ncbi:MAG: hypothetical protein ACI945_002311 [Pseudohongiellaceae bacterium]|jgi:hypothetical protein
MYWSVLRFIRLSLDGGGKTKKVVKAIFFLVSIARQLRGDYHLFRLNRIVLAELLIEKFETTKTCHFADYVSDYGISVSISFWDS